MLKKHYTTLRNILLVFTALFLTVGIVLGITSFLKRKAVFAETPTVLSEDIKSQYINGTYTEFPLSVYVAYGMNDDISAEFSGIRMPDGSVYAHNSIDFSTNGIYNVLYSFTYENKKMIAEKPVKIVDQLYQPFSGASTVEYGELAKLGGEGLNLTLSAGDVFTFNKPINLYETDLIDVITLYPELIENYDLYVAGKSSYGADCLDFMVSITDAYDPTNVVVFKTGFKQDKRGGTISMVISEHGRVSMVEYTPSYDDTHSKQYGQISLNGKFYYIWKAVQLQDADNRYGFSSASYVRGGMTWQFGGTSNQIYLRNARYNDQVNLLEDLDSQDVTTVTGKFRPFTTGEVYVSIYGERWQNSSTKVQIKSIGNYSGEELKGEYIIDDIKPTVNVDVDMGGQESLIGVVYNPIKIFDATATDINGAVINTKVYQNYGTSQQTVVSVKNGMFTPTVAGNYAIVYVASDSYGNTQSKVVPIVVINPNKTNEVYGAGIDLLNVKDVTLESIVIGNEITLEEPELYGYNGKIKHEKSVFAPDGSQVKLQGSTFRANMLGKYTIKYEYYDNLYRNSYSYQVECLASDSNFFLDEPSFQKYYILGAKYKLDDYFAYYFENGETKSVLAKLYVKYEGTEDFFEIADINNFTVGLNQTGDAMIDINPNEEGVQKPTTVTFKYKYGEAETAEYTKTIADVNYKVTYNDEGKISLFTPENYFYGNFSAVGFGLAQRYTSNTLAGNNTLEFINPLLTDNFSFNFKVPEEMLNYKKMVFTLTDANDPTNKVSLQQYFETWHSYIQVGDNPRLDVTIFGEGESVINSTEKRISYSSSSNKITYNNGNQAFDFFLDKALPKFVYFSVEFVEIAGEVGIDILQINGQSLSIEKDMGTPIFSINASSGYYRYGSEVVLHVPIVSDILSPVSIKGVTITVIDASGAPVKSKEGVILNNAPAHVPYTIVALSEEYKVDYANLIDDCGNKATQTYKFYVSDFDKPIISFNDGSNENTVVEASVGKEITIKNFTVTDNKSAIENIQVVITIVNLKYYNWVADVDKSTLKYTPERVGDYLVKVSARDEAGNFQVVCYQLKVR